MPKNVINFEGSITVRFEVNPNGTIGLVKRVHEMEPMFEREILKALGVGGLKSFPTRLIKKDNGVLLPSILSRNRILKGIILAHRYILFRQLFYYVINFFKNEHKC